jgi:hypothetical protein
MKWVVKALQYNWWCVACAAMRGCKRSYSGARLAYSGHSTRKFFLSSFYSFGRLLSSGKKEEFLI